MEGVLGSHNGERWLPVRDLSQSTIREMKEVARDVGKMKEAGEARKIRLLSHARGQPHRLVGDDVCALLEAWHCERATRTQSKGAD